MLRSIHPIFAGLVLALALAFGPAGAARAETAADDGTGEMILGKPDAPILIVAYVRMTCSHCADFHIKTLPKLKEAYVDKGLVKIAFREFPGSREDPWSGIPAMMARCLGKDRYFTMLDMLFANQEKWTNVNSGQQLVANVAAYGRLAGLTQEQFDACLKNAKLLAAMQQRWSEGESKHQGSTPYFIIGDKEIAGSEPFEAFEDVLKPMVAKLPAQK